MTPAPAPPEQADRPPLHAIADGFVLAGGFSSRMGRSKAMLPWRGKTLLEHVAGQVLLATGSVRLVGAAQGFEPLSFEMIPDAAKGCGPVGGIVAALRATARPWALITACDLPNLDWRHLVRLREDEDDFGNIDAVIPIDPENRLHPLCALYHRRTLPAWEAAVRIGNYRLQSVTQNLRLRPARRPDANWLTNVNTPAEWAAATGEAV